MMDCQANGLGPTDFRGIRLITISSISLCDSHKHRKEERLRAIAASHLHTALEKDGRLTFTRRVEKPMNQWVIEWMLCSTQ
jgi:hypothetical protein